MIHVIAFERVSMGEQVGTVNNVMALWRVLEQQRFRTGNLYVILIVANWHRLQSLRPERTENWTSGTVAVNPNVCWHGITVGEGGCIVRVNYDW
jgi:hypothetical protein